MTDTRTLILWPTRLKIGAKSKKGIVYVINDKQMTNIYYAFVKQI